MGDDDGIPPAMAQIIDKILEQDSKYSIKPFSFHRDPQTKFETISKISVQKILKYNQKFRFVQCGKLDSKYDIEMSM